MNVFENRKEIVELTLMPLLEQKRKQRITTILEGYHKFLNQKCNDDLKELFLYNFVIAATGVFEAYGLDENN